MTRAGVLSTIGGTPLVRLQRLHGREDVRAWLKLESANPGGSAKDRTALALFTDAVERGAITPRSTLVESSSGNFGVAAARLCLLHGVGFHCVVDPRANRVTVATMLALGAHIHALTEPDPETGDWLVARRAKVRELLATLPDAVCLDQYSNPAAPRAHADGTMTEIVEQLGRPPTTLYTATSTTGTIGGCLAYVHERGLATRVVAVDAQGSVLFGGERGERPLSGYGAGMVPPLAEGLTPDAVVRVSALEAVRGCRRLVATEGVLAGGSTGAVVSAFLADLDATDAGADVVLICHDGGVPYLDTVYDDAWVAEHLGGLP